VTVDLSTLPDDSQRLKEIIHELQSAYTGLEKTVAVLTEELRLARAQRFGRKSEKWTPEDVLQGRLFNEAEANSQRPAEPPLEVRAYTRGKPRRRPLPSDLPRETVTIDVSAAEKLCFCGKERPCIGEEVHEKLDIIPAQVKVIRTVRKKYGLCPECAGEASPRGGAVRIAPVEPQLLPKSIATEGLIAYILISKFCDGLPFYRLEKIFARMGIDINRTSMCEWAIKVAQRLGPLLELLKRRILEDTYAQVDETTVQVLRELGRSAQQKSYMWVFRSGGNVPKPTVIFEYHPSRSGAVPLEFFIGYTGWVQTDGYIGYEELGRQPGIIHLGCMGHIRREFHDVLKAGGRGTNADVALEFIRSLYMIEREAREKGLSWEQRKELRQLKAVPILEKFHLWLEEMKQVTLPKGLFGKAIAYALGQWERATRYVTDGRLEIDNNLVENAIRAFVIGRNAWLFSVTPDGAKASALFYSLIETARACGLEPYWYLRYVLKKVVSASSESEYAALLPHNLTMEILHRVEAATPPTPA
jgi:transposase